MSVVILTPDRYDTIRLTMRHLQAQTVRDQLEIVVVAPAIERLEPEAADLAGFRKVELVETPASWTSGQARAAGVRRASAAVVAFTEEHSFPEPGWAAALLEAHRRPWAAVGPAMANANPDSVVSWVDMLLAYALWLDPAPAQVCEHLPGHNSSYKRGLLLAYGERLPELLESETVLHWELRAQGHQLYLEPAARTRHLNFSLPGPGLRAQLHSGRVLAATRVREWSTARRLLYCAGAPIIPLVRLRRIIRELRRPGRPSRLLPRLLPALVLWLGASAIGELLGYAFGVGDAVEQASWLEFHRVRYLRAADRRALLAAYPGRDGA
jgi:hypothetical protein